MNNHIRWSAVSVREACAAVLLSPFGCVALGLGFLGIGMTLRQQTGAAVAPSVETEVLRDALRDAEPGAKASRSRERELMDRMEAELRQALTGFEGHEPLGPGRDRP